MATIDAKSHDRSVVPFYKASFVWIMSRQTTDYFLRVVVPLAILHFVAYLSIFIPRTKFQAIVTIQVTALLSAVALYLALPKIDADTTTPSTGYSCSRYVGERHDRHLHHAHQQAHLGPENRLGNSSCSTSMSSPFR